jgi:hypothetical protein
VGQGRGEPDSGKYMTEEVTAKRPVVGLKDIETATILLLLLLLLSFLSLSVSGSGQGSPGGFLSSPARRPGVLTGDFNG